jgi:hypothetical protein
MTNNKDNFSPAFSSPSVYDQQISSLNPDFDDLDPEEQELLESIDTGEWVSELTPERLRELQEDALKTLGLIHLEKGKEINP